MIYIHVPFCEKRCIYCDFYSTTQGADQRKRYVRALCSELEARQGEIADATVRTLYFGGGTPSQLEADELTTVMDCIRRTFRLQPDAEITFEANPDDVTPQRIGLWQQLGINRVSLGVQTFDDQLLQMLNRRHTAQQAREAVNLLTTAGIDNVSIDLIYGLPQQSAADFGRDLTEAFSLPIRHLSSYALSVEPGTAMSRKVEKGEMIPADEETCLTEYEMLMDAAAAAGFEHYEISNFALPGFHSRHNSAYWDGTPYLGCGPGAHSYDGHSLRRQNLPELSNYILQPGNPPHETEVLSSTEQYDELVFTALRTRRGLSLPTVRERHGADLARHLLSAAAPHIAAGRLSCEGNVLCLTRKGIFVSDDIISDLMA